MGTDTDKDRDTDIARDTGTDKNRDANTVMDMDPQEFVQMSLHVSPWKFVQGMYDALRRK
jgi:hypothetical protein